MRIASAYDPLSGASLSKALHFAPLAAQAIADALAPYNDAIQRDFSTYLKQRLVQYTNELRWAAWTFWQRRHTWPAAMTELPHLAARAHVECESPFEKPRRDTASPRSIFGLAFAGSAANSSSHVTKTFLLCAEKFSSHDIVRSRHVEPR